MNSRKKARFINALNSNLIYTRAMETSRLHIDVSL